MIDNYYNIIDLDYFVDEKGRTARNLILRYKLYDGELPKRTQCIHHELFEALLYSKTYDFIEKYSQNKSLSSVDRIALLYRALCFGEHEIFDHLLGDITETLSLSVFVEAACLKGFYKIADRLLDQENIKYNHRLIVRIVTLPKIVEDEEKHISHVKCLDMILNHFAEKKDLASLKLNVPDDEKKTVLQHAISHKNPKIIHVLLKYGASLLVPKEKG